MELTPRLKLKLFALALSLLIGLAYQFSIRKTIETYNEFNRNKVTLEKGQLAPSDISTYRRSIDNLNNKLGQYAAYDRASLFEEVNTFCQQNRLTLANFQAPEITVSKDYCLLSTPIIVEGNYTDMVRLVYHLEQTQRLGRMANARFKIVKDRKQKKEKLKATLLLQNIQNIKEGHQSIDLTNYE